MRSRFLIAAAAVLAFATAAPHQAAADDLNIAGSTSVVSAILEPFEDKIERLANTTYAMRAIGSSRGILALVDGSADIAAISAPLAVVVQKLNAKNPGSVNGRALVAHQIGATRVAFVVNASNSVKHLTLQQATDILSGRIKFWSQIGGVNLPIEVVTAPKGDGVRTLVEETIGKWGDVLSEPTEVQSAVQVVFAVSQLPAGFGVATTAAVDNSVFALSMDETIEQPLFLVTMGEPTPQMQRVIDAARSVGGSDGTTGGS